ncbi:BppU family phage baseplate upper protein [Lactococcus petauri]|uniref:BppU family phage baseplate upper protein n=1 Tax=Lactococcus petauri TaxID=1940789 RepID=UPI0018A9E4D1|nr:BppU family phage baseplate upper protein [Lactococcus petauri]MDC0826870.1 BppU family phage baseplate upper protein [Lactococcus petauri]
MSYKTLNLDLAKSPILKSIVYGRIGDGDMQTITVNVTSRDVPVNLTGYTITFEGVTNGGQTKVFDVEGVSTTEAGLALGKFDYTFPNMAFAVAGNYEIAYFSIMKEGKRDTTGEFDIIVSSNADIDAEEAKTIITLYDQLVTQLKQTTSDYLLDADEKFALLTQQVADFQTLIDSYKGQVEDTASSVIQRINEALTNFENGNFYTKDESDARFALKSETGDSYTKAESDARFALGTDVVHLTGDETVSGKKTFEEKISLSSDIPETPLTFLDGFEAYPNQEPVYSKENGRVYLEGAVRTTKEIPAGSTGMFALPAGCRPSVTKDQICPGSNTTLWTLSAESGGMVKVSNYRTTYPAAPSSNIPLGTRLPISMSFKIAD